MSTRFRSAISLIEVLVVIGIMLVLLSLLIPVLDMVRNSAKRAECASHLRQVGMVFFLHRVDYKIFPQRDLANRNNKPHVIGDNAYPGIILPERLVNYCDGKNGRRIFYCPQNFQKRTEKSWWYEAISGAAAGTYQVTCWVDPAIWMPGMPTMNFRTPTPSGDTLLATDYHGIALSGSNLVVYNHKRKAVVEGMNELFVDGRVEWVPSYAGSWTHWMTSTQRYMVLLRK
jgi:hypothetical protein